MILLIHLTLLEYQLCSFMQITSGRRFIFQYCFEKSTFIKKKIVPKLN